ncbi:hypothetical protein BDB01DRAFT_833701 [Pilobolus umbonatus]|nr:hypothetical protein BDB01DRAFT_833701 [Pilobolus umbonatus]
MSTVKAENIFVYCCRNDNYIAHPCISSNGSTLTQVEDTFHPSISSQMILVLNILYSILLLVLIVSCGTNLLVVVLMILTDRSFLSPNNMFIYVLNLTETTSHVIDFRCARSDTDLERSSGISHTPSWQMSRFWTKKYRYVRVPPAYLLGPTVPMTGHMFQQQQDEVSVLGIIVDLLDVE